VLYWFYMTKSKPRRKTLIPEPSPRVVIWTILIACSIIVAAVVLTYGVSSAGSMPTEPIIYSNLMRRQSSQVQIESFTGGIFQIIGTGDMRDPSGR
jgi:hypothetical protein